MMLYRISLPKRAEDLSGTGAKLFGGRWNSKGNAVLYTAENISLAMLEKLVHAEREMLQQHYSLCCIDVPDKILFQEFTTDQLPGSWRNFPFHSSTAALGDRWLAERSSAVLKVPSAVNPLEHNFLLNPLHEDFASVSLQKVHEVRFDLRLK